MAQKQTMWIVDDEYLQNLHEDDQDELYDFNVVTNGFTFKKVEFNKYLRDYVSQETVEYIDGVNDDEIIHAHIVRDMIDDVCLLIECGDNITINHINLNDCEGFALPKINDDFVEIIKNEDLYVYIWQHYL